MVMWLARRPKYIPLFFAVGWFLACAPRVMRKRNLRDFVRILRAGFYPRGPREAIHDIAAFWLIHFFPDRNTCYGRALTLYRFLDEPDRDVKLHMGIEPQRRGGELRGHAWVSLRGAIVEGPPEAFDGKLREVPLEQPA